MLFIAPILADLVASSPPHVAATHTSDPPTIAGTLVDAIRYDDTERSLDWDENWEARTSIAEKGWTAELKIPLRILRFETEETQAWDFEARRYISEKQETDEWAFIPRSSAGEV